MSGRRAVPAAALIVAVVAGCAAPIAGVPAAAPATSTPPVASASATPTAAPTPVAPAKDRIELLRSALLRPTEVGPNWQVATDQPAPDASAPAACGGQGVVARFPDAQRLGTALTSDGGERMQETLSVFADPATAGSAFDAFAAGLDCPSGTLGSTVVTISTPEDVRDKVQGERATSWSLTANGFSAALVSVTAGDQLVNFVFLTPKGGSLTRLDALALARTGVARLLAT